MKITQSYFNKYIENNYIFENNPKIAVAVSGGPDSMCLLFLLQKWIKKNKGNLLAIIVDHNIRKDSAIEAKKVNEYLINNNFHSHVMRVHKNKIKTQSMAEARNNRFDCLYRFCKKNKILHLFLGHHLDDNLETFLIRKIGGSNFDGLRCIKNKFFSNYLQILRPLLDVSKKDIIKYNKANKINFIIDPSNQNINFTRVVVRNFLLNESLHKKNIKNDFKHIKENYEFYKKMIFQSFHDTVIKIQNKFIFLDSKKFFYKDDLIQIKIIEIVYSYLKFKNKPLRDKKIRISLLKIKNNNNFFINLGGLLIKKDNYLIKFEA